VYKIGIYIYIYTQLILSIWKNVSSVIYLSNTLYVLCIISSVLCTGVE